MTLQTVIKDLAQVKTVEGIGQLAALYEIEAADIEEEMAAEYEFEMDDGA